VSHLFDDQGRKTDAEGLLRDWWTQTDAERFLAATDKLAVQVGSYEPLPGKHVNGKLTLGESIADVAGLTVSYDAYRRSLGGKEAPVIDGFTGDQRFFLAYAQMWRWKPRDAYLEQLLRVEVHPPTFVRPNTVRNIDAWYTAFDVKPGDKLYLPPEQRTNPW
jgi:putative endopeptidase